MKSPRPVRGGCVPWLLFVFIASAGATTLRTPNSTQHRLRKGAFTQESAAVVAVATQPQPAQPTPAAPPPAPGPSAQDIWRFCRQVLGYAVLAYGVAFWVYIVPSKIHSEHEQFLAEKLEGRTFSMYLAYRFNFWMDSEGLAATWLTAGPLPLLGPQPKHEFCDFLGHGHHPRSWHPDPSDCRGFSLCPLCGWIAGDGALDLLLAYSPKRKPFLKLLPAIATLLCFCWANLGYPLSDVKKLHVHHSQFSKMSWQTRIAACGEAKVSFGLLLRLSIRQHRPSWALLLSFTLWILPV